MERKDTSHRYSGAYMYEGWTTKLYPLTFLNIMGRQNGVPMHSTKFYICVSYVPGTVVYAGNITVTSMGNMHF